MSHNAMLRAVCRLSIGLVIAGGLAATAWLLPVLLAGNAGVPGIYALALIGFAATLLVYRLTRVLAGLQ